VLVVIAILLVIARPSETLFAIGVAYVISGPAEWLWRRHTGTARSSRPGTCNPPTTPRLTRSAAGLSRDGVDRSPGPRCR